MNSRIRISIAAVGAAAMLATTVPAASVAAPAAVAPAAVASVGTAVVAADPVYPPVLKPVSCKIKTNKRKTKVKVNMGPNLPGKQYYTFRLDKKTSDGYVRYLKTYKTKRKSETRTVNVKKGTWRAKCYSRGFPLASPRIDATSRWVKVRK